MAMTQNKDKFINNYGNRLVNVCKRTGMLIVNGRHECDALGEYTFINNNGKSTIDYLLTDNTSFTIIQNFKVESRIESCHMPLTFQLTAKSRDRIDKKVNIDTFDLIKYRWKAENELDFSA